MIEHVDLSAETMTTLKLWAKQANTDVPGVIAGIVSLYVADTKTKEKSKPVKKTARISTTGTNVPAAARRVLVWSADSDQEVTYESVGAACKQLNLQKSLVYCVLRGDRASTGGYHFDWVK